MLNLVAISSTWARIIDVMDSEVVSAALYFISKNWLLFQSIKHSSIQSGARLFGFVGAGATLGQLFGSVFAAVTAWMGPCMHHIV